MSLIASEQNTVQNVGSKSTGTREILKPADGKLFASVLVQEIDVATALDSVVKSPDSHIPPNDKCLSNEAIEERLMEMGVTQHDPQIVKRILELGEQVFFKTKENIVEQEDEGDGFFIILRGKVSVRVNNRPVETLKAGDFFGETCALSSLRRRNATIRALEDANLLVISRQDMRCIFEQFPKVICHVALTLTDRLTSRSNYIRRRNDTPEIFVGSSTKGAKLIDQIEKTKLSQIAVIHRWEGIFTLTESFLQSLIHAAETVDYALLIFTPDDWSLARRVLGKAPRANVVFELGLFLGALGKTKTFVMAPEGFDKSRLLIPTDLSGIQFLTYNVGKISSIDSPIEKLIQAIEQSQEQ